MRQFFHLFFISLFLFQSAAVAGLGEKETEIAKDQKALGLTGRKQNKLLHDSVHELTQETLRVKEYVDPQGLVFAVSWKGNSHPDLTALLGPYLREYQDAIQSRKKEKGHKKIGTIVTPHLVIEKSGTLRASQGRAYVPALIPAGVSINDIQ